MFTAERRVGRLIEVRMRAPLPAFEAQALADEIRRLVGRAPALGVLDLRRVVDAEVAAFVGELLRRDDPWLARAALLLDDAGASETPQLLAQSGSSSRRGFHQRQAAEAWLGEALDDAERARLRAFLDEPA